MQTPEKRADVLLVFLSLLLVALGEVYFLWLPQYVWDGALFCALGAFLWAVTLRRTRRGVAPAPPGSGGFSQGPRPIPSGVA